MDLLEDYIAIYDEAVPADFCDQFIELFENDNTPKGEHMADWRRCKEFTSLDYTPLWEMLKGFIKQSYDRYRQEHPGGVLNFANMIESATMFHYNVDPDKPNIFNFHADNWNFATSTRQVSIIIYLNDVTEGGETNFQDLDIKVVPKKRRMLLFPSFFNYIHKGEAPVSNSKYIIVTWIHFDGTGHAYRVHRL